MSNYEIIRLGGPGCVEASAGYKEWQRKKAAREQRSADRVHAFAPVASTQPPTTGTVLRANSRGHFCTQAIIEGHSLTMMVDTGATWCSLTEEDAARTGFLLRASDCTRSISTQNGVIKVVPVVIRSLQIGPIAMRNVEVVTTKSMQDNESVLGMSFLKRLRQFSMESGRLTLRG